MFSFHTNSAFSDIPRLELRKELRTTRELELANIGQNLDKNHSSVINIVLNVTKMINTSEKINKIVCALSTNEVRYRDTWEPLVFSSS